MRARIGRAPARTYCLAQRPRGAPVFCAKRQYFVRAKPELWFLKLRAAKGRERCSATIMGILRKAPVCCERSCTGEEYVKA